MQTDQKQSVGWNVAQKSVLTALGILMSVGTSAAIFSVKLQWKLSESIADHDRRLSALESWGPDAGPRVTPKDINELLTTTTNRLLNMGEEQARTYREQAQVLARVDARLAKIDANQASAQRERDAITRRLEAAEKKP